MEREEELYERHVMRHYEEPYHRGSCAAATHVRRVDNPVCGDSVQISLRINADILQAAWFTGTGCIISQAAASMLVKHVEGRSLAEVQQFSAPNMLALFQARLTPRRQQCCLLPWQTLMQALESPVS